MTDPDDAEYQRRIAELLREMQKLDRPTHRRTRRRRSRGARFVLGGALTVALLSIGGWVLGSTTGLLGSNSDHAGWPGRPTDAQEQPIGLPPEVDAEAGSYEFIALQTNSAEPVTYDPCVPIHLVVNPRTMVEGGSRLLDEAVASIQDATGLEIIVDGLTDEAPTSGSRPQRDAVGWPPVLVAWSDPQETPALSGQVAGVGGSSRVSRGDHQWFVTGAVTLDGPQLATILDRRRGHVEVRAVIMHELAHVIGLAHVDDSRELMHPESQGDVVDWGPGDRAGLAALGSGRCVDY